MGNSRGIALNHRQAIVLSSEPLKLPSCPGLFSNLWRGVGLQVEGTFPLSQLLPRGKVLSSFLPPLVLFFFFLLSYPSMWKSFLQCWMSEMFYLCLVGILWELFLMSLHFLFIVGGSELHVLFHHFDSFLSMKLYPSSLEFRLYQFYQILAKNIKIILYDVIRLLQRKAIVKNRFLLNVWK